MITILVLSPSLLRLSHLWFCQRVSGPRLEHRYGDPLAPRRARVPRSRWLTRRSCPSLRRSTGTELRVRTTSVGWTEHTGGRDRPLPLGEGRDGRHEHHRQHPYQYQQPLRHTGFPLDLQIQPNPIVPLRALGSSESTITEVRKYDLRFSCSAFFASRSILPSG